MTIKDIVTQHAEEAAFLWILRDAAVREPHYDLKDLTNLDNRVEAHIDGLRIAGDEGWQVCEEALKIGEPGEVFTAAVLAFEKSDGMRVGAVAKVGSDNVDAYRGLVSALGWLSDEQIQRWIPGLFSAKAPVYQHLGVDACAIHRQDPGPKLTEGLKDPDTHVQVRALRAAGALKRRDLLPALRERFESDDILFRFWSAWSGLLLGDRYALEVLKAYATVENPFREQSMQLSLRAMDSRDSQPWLKTLAEYPGARRYVIIGAGVAGDPVIVPWLIQQMTTPEYARVAGEAFSMISGIDIAYEDLEGEKPEGFDAGPTENPEDEDVALDQDENLPWPDPGLIHTWWDQNKTRYPTGVRHLCGKPINIENCEMILRKGYQRQRRAAALELALLQPQTPLFNTSAPGRRQQNYLAVA